VQPRLRDSFLSELYGFIPQTLRHSDSVDLDAIQRRLRHRGEQIIGPDVIQGILVQSTVHKMAR